MILRHLEFVKNWSVDFLLFHVVANNMVVVFHFPFVLVDNNQYLLGFVSKNFCFEMCDLVQVVAYVVLVYMVQKYLVDFCD